MVRYKVIQPSLIRFTTNKIVSHFDNGLDLNVVVANIIEGKIKPENIEAIRVFNLKGIYYTCDNRRLYVFRVAQSLGSLDFISAVVVSPCEFNLTVIKPGQDGKVITFTDGSEPYAHWQDAWEHALVIDRQISSSSAQSAGKRKGSSQKDTVTSRDELIERNPGRSSCCCICLSLEDYDDDV